MKILILSNFGMGLYKFRRELIKELLNLGHSVYIAMPEDAYMIEFVEMGCKFIDAKVDRRGINPFQDLRLLISYNKTIRKYRPDIVLTYTIKPNIYGGVICRLTNTAYITNVTGLGTAIESGGLFQKLGLIMYRIALKKSKKVFFQNSSNCDFFVKKKIVGKNSSILPGSGVNLDDFFFEPYPKDSGEIKLLFIGRIMKAKGIDELLAAVPIIKKKYPFVQFHIIGFCEEQYLEKLNYLHESKMIYYHGQQKEVKKFIKESHAIVLPTHHEGTSNVLLESAAMGRPVLASKVPGSIETFDEGISGLGFEAKNTEDLIRIIKNFIRLPYKVKEEMGKAGRKKMVEEYDRQIVVKAYINQINKEEVINESI